MKENKQEIAGVEILPLSKCSDQRGWLSEVYRNDNSQHKPKMAYASFTVFGMIRGPHEHVQQTDFFIFFGPGDFAMHLWDNRPNSSTFEKKIMLIVGERNPCSVRVPPGVVHGYKCISKNGAYYVNLPDALYAGKDKKEKVDEIRHEHQKDSKFKIN